MAIPAFEGVTQETPTRTIEDILRELNTQSGFAESPDYRLWQDYDYTGLTDEELNSRLGLLQELGGFGESVYTMPLDRASLEQKFKEKLESYGVASPERYSGEFADATLEQGGYPDPQTLLKRIQEKFGYGNPALENAINDQDFRNDISFFIDDQRAQIKPGDYIKQIQDLISSRSDEAAKDQDILTETGLIGDSLVAARQGYIGDLTSQANEQLQSEIPDYLALANTKGTLFSGDPGDYITSRAGQLYGGIEDIESQLMADEDQFYFNSAYQFQLRSTLKSTQDYRAALEAEQGRLQTQQQQSFLEKRQYLNNTYAEDRARRQSELSLQAQQNQLRRQKDFADRQSRFGLARGLGQAVGTGLTVAGLATGNLGLAAGGAAVGGGANQIG